MFDPNSTFLFILAGLVILFVIAQSVFFLVRAYRRGKALGMDMKQIRKTILSTAVFTLLRRYRYCWESSRFLNFWGCRFRGCD